jgi:hypothetical protein
VRCAVVGSGLAALAGYATLRHGGLAPEEIVVYGTHEDPLACWRRRAESIRQQRMRSESDGHVGAASFPGLAVREAWSEWTLRPLVATAASRYHPSVAAFVAHAERVVESSGWERSFVRRRVERIRAVDGGFELDGEGVVAHVLVAPGHPALRRVPGAVHAYEPHEYAKKVAIVGAGMAAATEWLNALAAGAEVVSIRRREPVRRPLNVPRPYFSRRGLAAYHRLPSHARVAKLHELTQPSYPTGADWDDRIDAAAREGRFRVERSGSDPGLTPSADLQVISATGFERGWNRDPLLRDLAEAHGLETCDRWIVLDPDSTVAALSDDTRTLSLTGIAGQWAFPAADTIAGAKYAARAFLRRVCRTR